MTCSDVQESESVLRVNYSVVETEHDRLSSGSPIETR